MNFFAEQDRARRLSRRLTLLFLLSIVCVVGFVDLVAWFAGAGIRALPWVSAAMLVCIAAGTLFRMAALAAGGAAVAQGCNGRRVLPSSQDPGERRLLDVVEEMAIAAGVAVPQTWVLDAEDGINAFAAGADPAQAVVAVTRGTLERLSRDELQGVVGHEFSHILNGDMRINLRMLGLLAGLELVAMIGVRVLNAGSGSRSRSNGQLALIGFGLLAAGYAGKLCADVIRAALSRQREYLADASAVQFTRNPDGIAGALLKIERDGSLISHAGGAEIAHMCLGAATRWKAGGLLATHPPIADRVARLIGAAACQERRLALERGGREARGSVTAAAPVPDAAFGRGGGGAAAVASAGRPDAPVRAPAPPPGFSGIAGAARVAPLPVEAVMDSIGRPDAAHLDRAGRILAGIPDRLRSALRTPTGAKALLAAMLAAEDRSAAGEGPLWHAAGEDAALALATALRADLAALGPAVRLPLLDLAMPVLSSLPEAERTRLLELLSRSVAADAQTTFFEFVLVAILAARLGPPRRLAASGRARPLASLADDAAVVLAAFAQVAGTGPGTFDAALRAAGCPARPLPAPAQIGLAALGRSLARLREAEPLAKPALVKACLQIVLADGTVSEGEFALMRAVCAAIDSPVPPAVEFSAPPG